MAQLDFKCLLSHSGVFVKKNKNHQPEVIAVVHVDDAIFMGPNKSTVSKAKSSFMKTWKCRDLGDTKEFLQMHIQREDGFIVIDQTAYLQKVLQHFGMTNAKAAVTPLPAGYVPSPNSDPLDERLHHKYQQVIGSLLYIMLGTRPDIAFAVTKLSQFASNPSKDYLAKALYICICCF
jgi:hypothetical protein